MAHIPEALLALGKFTSEAADITVGTRENLVVPAHSHPTSNYVVVTAGRLYLTLNEVEQELLPGDWALIPAGADHAERFEEKTSVIVFWLK